MPRYSGGGPIQYASVGGSIADALTELITERQVKQRQAMLDAMEKQERESREKDRVEARKLQAAQLESADAQRKEAIQRMQQQRAAQVASNLGIKQRIDAATAQTLREGDLGGLVDSRVDASLNVTDGLGTPTADNPLGLAASGPGGRMSVEDSFAGTAEQHEQVRAAQALAEHQKAQREAAADLAKQNREAANERAREANELRETLARIAASSKGDNQALANELKRLQIDMARDKFETGRTERTDTATSQREQMDQTLATVNAMLDPEGVGAGLDAATGAYELRGFTQPAQDFNTYRNQLVASLTVPNLKHLKGPLSDKDIQFVQNLSTNLSNTRMSGTLTRENLQKLQKRLTEARARLNTPAPAGNPGGGAGTQPAPGASDKETPEQRRARLLRAARGEK